MTTLDRLPPSFSQNRLAMHRLAAYVISPARRKVAGRMGLEALPGGFGTPAFENDNGESVVVAANGTNLEVRQGGALSMVPVTTLNAAAAFLDDVPDVEWASQQDIPEPGDLDADLALDADAVASLANWFDFGWGVLLDLAADADSVDPSQPTLWPEHFDPAIETGSDEAKQRASYGASPGDGGSDEPYLYVGPWYPDARPDSDYWNASSFPGAALGYAELAASVDPVDRAATFLRQGRQVLTGR